MSAARRSLLTATAAGTLLGALWFVPSANATGVEPPGAERRPPAVTELRTDDGSRVASASYGEVRAEGGTPARLADTGSFNTGPYVFGGTVFLCVGAGFVAFSVHRARTLT
ncbi:hypothetical protein [Streptomyces uncialis]|uniref:LPXTG-domain-containing protein cell wall anchor domain protein n=1 Tax=Streptomyces uncialis TaxID=1048205 RepID=A0A1Q4VE75_9ACTN|nr:hypothetical protein [Streptomyces uncialis]OKH96138.1 LPXTG-domain-containing protein cell wall anchor domain protein [Streptomyces uncialis]